jgi:monofunctional glycosyltransferase
MWSDWHRQSPRAPRARRVRRGAVRVLAWTLVAAVLTAVVPVVALRWIDPPVSAFMMERRVEGLLWPSRRVSIEYRWMSLDRISEDMRLAVIASEDQRFLEHGGFDVDAIRRALDERERGLRLRGASTISQQVAKNLFLWPGRSFLRKGLEAGFTVLIEAFWSKRRILEVYLNIAEFGDGVYGAGAASRHFYGIAPARLTRHESAILAAVLPSPRRMHVDRPSMYVQRRAWWIERQMVRLGPDYLTSL